MDSTRWNQIQALFHEAVDLPHLQQRAFLQSACGDDDDLMADVLALLEEDARGSSMLDSDVAHVAHEILDEATLPVMTSKGFGLYRIVRVLGEGGMGVVYLAERADLGSQVAIKVLRDAWLSPMRRDRFAIEQRTLALLNHPSIARLYDADTSPDGTPFFVMEYVEGVPLTEYCEKQECSLEERLKIFHVVCEAVSYAHQHESRGGYEILINKMSPGVAWLMNARKDLVEEYDALQKPAEAAKFRAELAALESKNSEIARK